MKVIRRSLAQYQVDEFFRPIRDKGTFIEILLSSTSCLLIDDLKIGSDKVGEIKLVVDKMSRLFFFSGKKSFSIAYPFYVDAIKNKAAYIKSMNNIDIDSFVISRTIEVMKECDFTNSSSLLEFYSGAESEKKRYFQLLYTLLQQEPGYIRYDFDPKNERDGIHPKHHVDINYSNFATYKLGLKNELSNSQMENMLDIKTSCLFLNN